MENDWQFSNHLCQTSSKSSQATNMKNAKKIPCWLQDYGLLFLSPRMPQVLGRSPAPSSGPRSPNRPIAYFYEESVLWKYIKYIILTLLFFLYQRRE